MPYTRTIAKAELGKGHLKRFQEAEQWLHLVRNISSKKVARIVHPHQETFVDNGFPGREVASTASHAYKFSVFNLTDSNLVLLRE